MFGLLMNGRIPTFGGRVLTAEGCQERSDCLHDDVGSFGQRGPVHGPVRESAQVHGLTYQNPDGLSRKDVEALGVPGENLMGTPVGHRNNRCTCLQCQAGSTSVPLHRPQVRIPGQGSLGVDNDGASSVHPLFGDLQRAVRSRRRAFNRNLVRRPQQRSQHRCFEESCLREEVRRTLLVVEHVPDHDGINFSAVVRCCDEAARGELPGALPLLAHQEVHQRTRHARQEHERGPALGRFLQRVPRYLVVMMSKSAPRPASFSVKRSYPRLMISMPVTLDVPVAAKAAMRWLNPPRRWGFSIWAPPRGVGPEITAECRKFRWPKRQGTLPRHSRWTWVFAPIRARASVNPKRFS